VLLPWHTSPSLTSLQMSHLCRCQRWRCMPGLQHTPVVGAEPGVCCCQSDLPGQGLGGIAFLLTSMQNYVNHNSATPSSAFVMTQDSSCTVYICTSATAITSGILAMQAEHSLGRDAHRSAYLFCHSWLILITDEYKR